MMELHNIDGCPKYRVFHNRADAISFIHDYEGDLAIKPIGLTGGKGSGSWENRLTGQGRSPT